MNAKKRIAWIVKILFWLIILAFFTWTIMNDMFRPIFEDFGKFSHLLGQHIIIVVISGFLAIMISIPLGIFVTRERFQKFEFWIVNIANLGHTIPSLAVLALAMGFLGIGMKAAIVALLIYSLLPILQNTIAGIRSVDKNFIDAARGMGLTPFQILIKIELPNAAASIIAGIRTAIIINIGTAALAYLIGGGGLGAWIFTGIRLFDNAFLISGAVPVTLLAILVDYFFKIMRQVLVPEGLRLAKK
ncbi:ABC transporter permease [Bacillus sp. JJ1562]|uniref:ABC transporter permease n=1 Tax=Bacillus sp. JJ1562 TaxID=3122960 RepID=UPI0030020DFA